MSLVKAFKAALSVAGSTASALKTGAEAAMFSFSAISAANAFAAGAAVAVTALTIPATVFAAIPAFPTACVIGGAVGIGSLIQSNNAKSTQSAPQTIIIYAADSEVTKELIKKEKVSTPAFVPLAFA